jgi:hypothetical protein
VGEGSSRNNHGLYFDVTSLALGAIWSRVRVRVEWRLVEIKLYAE